MRYEKAETVLRVALDMQTSPLGLSLEEIQRNYSDKPLSRRTAERLRDAVERLYPQIEQANPGEVPKRWRLPGGTMNGLASVTAAELAALGTAVSLLRRENMDLQAENAERGIAKMRALVRRPAMNRIEPDLEALTEAEGLAMRPGPRPKIAPETVIALREAIITRRKVKLHYLYRGTGPSAPGRCAWCGNAESPGAPVLPFGTEPETHTWLHTKWLARLASGGDGRTLFRGLPQSASWSPTTGDRRHLKLPQK